IEVDRRQQQPGRIALQRLEYDDVGMLAPDHRAVELFSDIAVNLSEMPGQERDEQRCKRIPEQDHPPATLGVALDEMTLVDLHLPFARNRLLGIEQDILVRKSPRREQH